MTETRFTPGPWVAETVRTSCGLCHKIGPFPAPEYSNKKPSHACLYDDYPPSGGSPELVANVRLIAAAPELYEALSEPERRLRQCASNIEDFYPLWARDLLKMADEMASVLAKARGEHEGEKA